MIIIIVSVIVLLALITFLVLGLMQLHDYKKATTAFYNYNKQLLENVAKSNNETNLKLSDLATNLNNLATNLESIDPSEGLVLNRIDNIQELIEKERHANNNLSAKLSQLNSDVTKIVTTTKTIKSKSNRKFKNYN